MRPGISSLRVLPFVAALSPTASASEALDPRRGIELAAAYTADGWHNARGGLRRGTAYLDNLDLQLALDGEMLAGVPGLQAYAHVLYNNDARFSERYVGDAMVVSNIDAPRAWRLYEAWIEWAAPSSRPLSLRAGLYDLNSEFDAGESRGLFLHSSHGVGHDLGQTGENGPSIFPVTSLGLRLAWEPAAGWQFRAAVLDGVPGDPGHATHTAIELGGDDGALAIAEVQSTRGWGTVSLGHWRYSARFDDLRDGVTGDFPERAGNSGTYAAFELPFPAGRSPGREQALFLRAGIANGRINEFDRCLSAGWRVRGPIATRPDDEIGIAFSHAGLGGPARAAGAAAGQPRDSHESAVELTWRAPLTGWLTLQPSVQYIRNPGADRRLRDALAIGLRMELSAAWSW